MAYSIPLPLGGLKGSGLGNQAIVLGKAWIAAELLGHTLVDLPWALNPRRYSHELGGSHLTAARYVALMKGLAPKRISAHDYVNSGEVDYGNFLLANREKLSLTKSLLHASGMTGGYAGITRARAYLTKRFLYDVGPAVSVAADLDRIKLDAIVVSVHVRAGDFSDQEPTPGEFNRRTPMDWYVHAAAELIGLTSDNLSLQVVTEPDAIGAVREAFAPLASSRVSVQVNSRTSTEDLAVLTTGDVLVTSVSSFSLLGAFLSQKPYIWYRPQTTEIDGRHRIWADPESTHFTRIMSAAGDAPAGHGRGLLSPIEESRLNELSRGLGTVLHSRRPRNDLLMYGEVR